MAEVKERIITTIVLIVSLVVAGLIFTLLNTRFSAEAALLVALPLGILINVVYLLAFYEESHDAKKKINTLTQIWAGIIIIASSVIVGIIRLIFEVDISTLLICLTAAVLILIFASIRRYDRFLESRISRAEKRVSRPAVARKKKSAKKSRR